MDTRTLVKRLLATPGRDGKDGLGELINALQREADLSEDQARAAADVVAAWLRDEEKRRKVIAAAVAATTASVIAGS